MKSYLAIKMEAEQRARDYRNVSNVTGSEEFQKVYEAASDAQRGVLEFNLIQANLDAIREFIKLNTDKESLLILKERAKRLGVKNWCRKNKFQLAQEVQEHERRLSDPKIREFKVPTPKPRVQAEPDGL
jgi:hypothetical protein